MPPTTAGCKPNQAQRKKKWEAAQRKKKWDAESKNGEGLPPTSAPLVTPSSGITGQRTQAVNTYAAKHSKSSQPAPDAGSMLALLKSKGVQVPVRKADAALAGWHTHAIHPVSPSLTKGPIQKEGQEEGLPAPAAGSMLALLKSKGVRPVASAANSAGKPGEVTGYTPLSKTADNQRKKTTATGREMHVDEQGARRSAQGKPTDTTGVATLSRAAKNAVASNSLNQAQVKNAATAAAITDNFFDKHESVTARPRRGDGETGRRGDGETVTARPQRHSTFKEAIDTLGRIYYWDV